MTRTLAATTMAALLAAGCAAPPPEGQPRVIRVEGRVVYITWAADPNNLRPMQELANRECAKQGLFARLNSYRTEQILGEIVFDCVGL
jgi:ABC-type glycerol-3-phosphate transport system substrate-binding protein